MRSATIMKHQERLPSLLAAAGEPDIVEKLKAGHQAGDKHFKVHIDGYNALSYVSGETAESPRDWFFYTNDDGLIVAIRLGDWKAVFYEQRAKAMQVWSEPFVPLRLPKIFNLRFVDVANSQVKRLRRCSEEPGAERLEASSANATDEVTAAARDSTSEEQLLPHLVADYEPWQHQRHETNPA